MCVCTCVYRASVDLGFGVCVAGSILVGFWIPRKLGVQNLWMRSILCVIVTHLPITDAALRVLSAQPARVIGMLHYKVKLLEGKPRTKHLRWFVLQAARTT